MTDSKFSGDFLPLLKRKRRAMGFVLGSQEAFKIAVKEDIQILQPRKIRTIVRQENATQFNMGINIPEF